MKYKFMTIPAQNPEASEQILNAFCSQHQISYIEKQLVMDGANSFWTFCISWQDVETSTDNRGKPKVDYKQILSETDFTLYLELRNHRKTLAEQLNVPPYALFTNEQLAAMVQKRIHTKTALSQIPGVGKSRIDNYGDSFLAKLEELFSEKISRPDDEANSDQS